MIEVTCKVPQGSVLGSILWNVFYNSLLWLKLPQGASLVAFADDVTVVIIGHNIELLETITNDTFDKMNDGMSRNGLQVAPHKSEAVILTRKWAYKVPKLLYGGQHITVKKAIKYLGVQLDMRLTFREQPAYSESPGQVDA